jgi:hypothetical protein
MIKDMTPFLTMKKLKKFLFGILFLEILSLRENSTFSGEKMVARVYFGIV